MSQSTESTFGSIGHCDLALAAYDRRPTGVHAPRDVLLAALRGSPEQAWLECAQALVLRNEPDATRDVLHAAIAEYPQSSGIRLALAGILLQSADGLQAEPLLRAVLADEPGHAAATLLLARLLKEQGRMSAAATAVRACFDHCRHDAELVIRAVELLDDCGRTRDAAALCESEIAAGSADPRLHAYAGMLLSQTGQFELARKRQEFALGATPQALEWHVPHGLSGLQHYADESHPDFARFQQYLLRTDISSAARASLQFALGKAHDDIGDHARAAVWLRQANALVHAGTRWPRKAWRRSIEARIGRQLPTAQPGAPLDWAPLFIVGMPRSGTTLLANRLARHPDVCQRGELPWMPMLAEQIATGTGDYRARLERAAAMYAVQLRQDDSNARWMVDKQPHNFMHVDLILAMFPNARFLYCRRNARDNALSVWMQSFQAGSQDFGYDFTDIGAVIHGSRRLMKHWLARYPEAIRIVDYERLTADSAACLNELSAWLELPAHDLPGTDDAGDAIISTASLWQARQPIHTRSVGRWQCYAPHVPELLQLPDD
jgi:tetratricopeptide (TPR) repeat protein